MMNARAVGLLRCTVTGFVGKGIGFFGVVIGWADCIEGFGCKNIGLLIVGNGLAKWSGIWAKFDLKFGPIKEQSLVIFGF
ncbi:hypothetical protein KY290_005565 [Solanum tuberosum]|uniref:Transmembrane protein n=1 Tax=Solanum tuberosum TaxID=4113 RepID=A0ABQ7WEI3_SOLTU|nr:hypothetical protein KY289_005944 [Solanum tuberosum]KAH0779138.1 hypothetical protein KY290_005565 [Solanum tuberosum]